MLRPVGSHSPSVYWRRRFLLLGSVALVVVLIVLTVRAVTSGGGDGQPAAAGTTPTTAVNSATPSAPANTAAQRPTHATSSHAPKQTRTSRSAGTGAAGNAGGTFSGSPKACTPAQLKVAAAVGKHKYSVGDEPNVMLQVTNTGSGPCVQDLADKQVVLEIYNGASRVWGSHDCHIEPGVHKRTLGVDKTVRVSIIWSGLSSRPHCEGTRQRVGAGTYTLYASLSGHRGAATQFSIS